MMRPALSALASLTARSEFETVRRRLLEDAAIADVVQAIAWPEDDANPRGKLFGGS